MNQKIIIDCINRIVNYWGFFRKETLHNYPTNKSNRIVYKMFYLTHVFFNSSFTVSITERSRKFIISLMLIKLFFIFLRILVMRWILSINKILFNSLEIYSLCPKSIPNMFFKKLSFFNGATSSTLAWVIIKLIITPLMILILKSENEKFINILHKNLSIDEGLYLKE